MITEDYVSFETAKLLKEKGFNEEVRTFYNSNGKLEDCAFSLNHNLDIGSGFTSAPSQSLALKWLREIHNRHISIEHSYILNKYKIYITKYNPDNISDLNNTLYFSADYDFSTYEEACEAALKYTLENLI